MRVLRQDLHLYPIVPIVLREASSQCEAVQEQSEFNAGINRTTSGARREYTETRRHFELSESELNGCLSEYEIDCARRRGWM
jgi:hypothetical protein